VALLVLLARAAGAGVVTPDFGARPDGLWGFGLGRAGLELQVLLVAALALLDLPRD
jgi:hypothetical protein